MARRSPLALEEAAGLMAETRLAQVASTAGGWQLHRPPLPKIYTPSSCAGTPAACEAATCMTKKVLLRAKHNKTFADELCDRCECSLCLVCAKPVNRWTSPMGQTLETVTTRTAPPFTFAYHPADADMQRMREQHVLEHEINEHHEDHEHGSAVVRVRPERGDPERARPHPKVGDERKHEHQLDREQREVERRVRRQPRERHLL